MKEMSESDDWALFWMDWSPTMDRVGDMKQYQVSSVPAPSLWDTLIPMAVRYFRAHIGQWLYENSLIKFVVDIQSGSKEYWPKSSGIQGAEGETVLECVSC